MRFRHHPASPFTRVKRGMAKEPLLSSSTLLLGCTHGDSGADQRQMAERLREVADLPLALDVVLLGEEAEVVRQT
jgi:hypothetical protein